MQHAYKEAEVEKQGKQDTNDGTLIFWQQIGAGDMFNGKGAMEEMENSTSLMKREKGRKKKSKYYFEPYPAERSGDQNVRSTREGFNIQPITEQAHIHMADQVDEKKGPSEQKKEKAHEKQEGEWAEMWPSIGDMQNKKPSKKKQG
ncbi:hypothetical protein Ancab_023293 [Ancistrocladus abbreviatus]